MHVSVILPAAGFGVRMGENVPKQFINLGKKSILEHTLDALSGCSVINSLVLVVPKNEFDHCARYHREAQVPISEIVIGGKERQDSVKNGFKAIPGETDIVVVHDGVRPFITPSLIESVVDAAAKHGAALCAVPVVDTIKKTDDEDWVQKTLDRTNLWRVQTPQAFKKELLEKAFDSACADNFYATDEAGLIERLGQPVKIVMGSEKNIKITRPEDLSLAEAFLHSQNNK